MSDNDWITVNRMIDSPATTYTERRK